MEKDTKQTHDYAIVMCCTPGYAFGLLSTMNAQNFFKTNADWEIAYEGFESEYMQKISRAFPFKVNWTPIKELMKNVVDKRTDPKRGLLNRHWLSYWLLAHKLLKEKKYKVVCVIQADEFVCVNLDVYFKIAEAGFLISSEYAFSFHCLKDLPFGSDKEVWDRSMCAAFDYVNFIGQQYTQLPADIVHFQEEDSFKGESNHSVIALNRSICRHGSKDKVLGLERHLWGMDASWSDFKFGRYDNKIYNDRKMRINGWHCRWWAPGRAKGEFVNIRKAIIDNKNNEVFMKRLDNLEHNMNLTKSFQEKFNDMIPEIKWEKHLLKGPIRRPKYELGEK